MRIFLFSLIILGGVASQAKDITLIPESLGVTITLKDSRLGEPVASISDKSGTNYSGVVKGINSVIADHTLHCFEGGVTGAINQAVGCDWIGFQPTDAKIIPYNSFLEKYPHKDLALVVRGKITRYNNKESETFFIPIQYLVTEKKKGGTIHWWFTDGGVRNEEDYRFNKVNVDSLFSN